MCFVCAETVAAAAGITVMALPFRARIAAMAKKKLQELADLFRLCQGECTFTFFGVKRESSRTMYHWNGVGEDPNRDVFLCRSCAVGYHEYWDERWSEVNSDRM